MASTKTRDDSMEGFYQALGRFMTMFAMVETNLFITIRIMTNIPPDELRVLMPNARANSAIDKVRKLLGISSQPEPDKRILRGAMEQLGHINSMRNSLLHHTLFDHPSETGLLTTDALFVRSGGTVKFRSVSEEILRQMIDDLLKIYHRLHWWENQILTSRGFSQDESPERQELFTLALSEPWKYKPVSPLTVYPDQADPDNTDLA